MWVCQQNAAFGCRPGEDVGIGRGTEPHILYAHHVEIGALTIKAPQDIAVEVSSLTSLSTRILPGFRAGQQRRTQVALGALALLDGASSLCRSLVARAKVLFKRFRRSQIATDDCVDVGKIQCVIRLDDGFGCCPGFEGVQDQLQQDPALADAKDARRFLAQWNDNGQWLEIQQRHWADSQ